MPHSTIRKPPTRSRGFWGRLTHTSPLPASLPPDILCAAWLALLASYSQADEVNLNNRVSGEPLKLRSDPGLDAHQFLIQVLQPGTVGDAFFTSGTIITFPLAEHRLGGQAVEFTTGFFQREADHAELARCHIAVSVVDASLTVSVDEVLASRRQDGTLAARLAGQLKTVARQLQEAKAGSMTLGDLDFMGPQDWEDAAESDVPYPETRHDTLHAMMARNSLPESPAVEAWDGTLTYAELEQASSSLARQLQRAGVGHGDFVPLFFEKSMWHPVSLFACSKVGAAWVTIPFDMPLHRVQSIMDVLRGQDDRAVRVGLALPSQEERAGSFIPTVIRVDTEAVSEEVGGSGSDSVIGSATEHEVEKWTDVDPKGRAYMVFTSGTTGQPKGIAIQQKSVCSFIAAWVKARGHGGGPGIRDGQILSYAFDVSLVEILVALCTGSCVCILSENERLNELAPALVRYRVTHLHATPSFSEAVDPAEVPTLQHIHFAGEWVTRALVDRWLNAGVDVFATYGPAEITNECLGARVAEEPTFASGCAGRPFGARVYITNPGNPHLRRPRGFVGEIIVEGPGVSLGYVGNPEQTAQAFVQDLSWAPSIQGRPRRFYRTGDLGYLDAEGLFYCRGRRDLQVKIHGQRIEVAEVESHIKVCMPQASRIAVDAIVVRGGAKALVAFLQLHDVSLAERPGQIEGLRTQLAAQLPPAFVPSAFIVINRMPLGNTGKTDRKRLKELVGDVSIIELLGITSLDVDSNKERPTASIELGAPLQEVPSRTTEAEVELRRIWATVLRVEPHEIRSESNFFMLGGNSLTAMKLVGSAHRRFQGLSVAQIFKHPTFGSLLESLPPFAPTTPTALVPAFQPQPDGSRVFPQSTTTQKAPLSELGGTLRKIWAAVLCVPPDDIHSTSNFFALGGNSLRAMKLVGQAHRASLSLSVGDIFRNPEFQALLEGMKRSAAKQLGSPLQTERAQSPPSPSVGASGRVTPTGAATPPHGVAFDAAEHFGVVPESIETVSPATPVQESLFALSKINEGVHVLQYEFTLPADASLDRLRWAWQRVVDRASILRTRLYQSPDVLYQVVLADDFHWEVRNTTGQPHDHARLRLQMASDHGSLSRFVVFHSRPRKLVWTVHHALTDGYATEMVLGAVKRAYRGHTLPKWEDFTLYSQAMADAGISPAARRFWIEALQDAEGIVPFPALPNVGYRACSDASVQHIMPNITTAPGTLYTIPFLLRVAWGLTVAQRMKTDDVVFGVVVSGRSDPKAMGVLGPLLNTIPFRLRVDREASIGSLLERAYQDMVAMMPFEGTGMGRIASISPALQQACGFQNVLNIQLWRPAAEADVPDEPAWLDAEGVQDSSSPLAVGCHFGVDGIRVVAQHDSAVISRSAVADTLANFARIAQALASIPAASEVGTLIADEPTRESSAAARHVTRHLKSCLPEGADYAVLSVAKKNAPEALVAFLDFGPGTSPSDFEAEVQRLRQALRVRVPEKLLPAAFYPMPKSLPAKKSQPESPEGLDGMSFSVSLRLGVDPAAIEEVAPATPYQSSVIHLTEKTPGFGTFRREYNILEGLDVEKLLAAWDSATAALPCLRARAFIDPETRKPLLITLKTGEKMDVCHHDTPAAEEAWIDALRIAAGTLGRPLARAAVVHTAGRPAVFVLALHHSVYDAAAFSVVWEALSSAYWTGQAAARMLPYSRLAAHVAGLDGAAAAGFWRRYLDGAPATVYPARPTPARVTAPTGSARLEIPLARRTGSPITTSTLVRAAWGLTVAARTGARDVVFRGLLSGRTMMAHDDSKAMPGPALVYVPVRVTIPGPGNDGVVDFLSRLQVEGAEMMPHEHLGLEAIAGLNPGAAAICASFNNALVVHAASSPEGTEPVSERPIPLRLESNTMDLTGYVALVLSCTIHEQQVVARTLHDPSVLDDEAASSVLSEFEAVLCALEAAERDPTALLRSFMNVDLDCSHI